MKFCIKETVNHFHEIEVDDEIPINNVIKIANEISHRFDTGYEAIEDILKSYQFKYGFDYSIEPNKYGTETLDIEIIDEVD